MRPKEYAYTHLYTVLLFRMQDHVHLHVTNKVCADMFEFTGILQKHILHSSLFLTCIEGTSSHGHMSVLVKHRVLIIFTMGYECNKPLC